MGHPGAADRAWIVGKEHGVVGPFERPFGVQGLGVGWMGGRTEIMMPHGQFMLRTRLCAHQGSGWGYVGRVGGRLGVLMYHLVAGRVGTPPVEPPLMSDV